MRANAAFYGIGRWFSIACPGFLLALAISTVLPSVALSGFDEGAASYRAGDYESAFKEWAEAAQQGDVDAQYNLGCLYVRGEGVPQNAAWGTEWLQRAADQDDLDAATWLLFSRPVTDDRRKEFFARKLKPSDKFRLTFAVTLSDGRLHRRPCSTDEKNGAEIAFSLGLMYEKGIAGFPQDDKQAAEWYRRASDRNFADAQANLAYLYAAGRGVEQNLVEAGRLFQEAAGRGSAVAQANLGFVYAGGSYGRKIDLVLAYVLTSHAADAGNKLAQDFLPQLKAHVPPDQLQIGQRLADEWKGNVPWPQEVADRLGSPN